MPFDEMAVAIPQPDVYAPILADLFSRATIPFKLHPSLPLATGRIARSFLLLLGSRDFDRGALLEFLTFAPVPLCRKDRRPRSAPSLGLRSDHPRTQGGLRHRSVSEGPGPFHQGGIEGPGDPLPEGHRSSRERRIKAARRFSTLVEKLHASLAFTGECLPLDQWSSRLVSPCAATGSDLRTRSNRPNTCSSARHSRRLAPSPRFPSPVSFDRVLSVIESAVRP